MRIFSCAEADMIKPKRLKVGDTIGIIAPASPAYDTNKIDEGLAVLKRLGFNIVMSNNCNAKFGYLAGEDHVRAEDINNFFSNRSVDGIICLRGGYGTLRLLNKINYTNIKRNPKVFVGYSDITALHSAIHKNTGLVTFHGPMVASDLSEDVGYNNNALISTISGKLSLEAYKLNPIVNGDISGVLAGGNLSVLCSLIGSDYIEDYRDKILFLEDIGEEPYRIDRMLHQLRYSGIINKVKGIILGQFTDCEAGSPEKSLSLDFVIRDFFRKSTLPVFSGLNAGHGQIKLTLPLGIKVSITDNLLVFKEEGVI